MKLAVFDLDGTLVDSLADIADATNFALRELELPEHELSKFNYFVGDGVAELIQRALPDDRQELFDEALKLYNGYYAKNYRARSYAYEGMKELLHSLKEKGVTLAVATNKSDYFAEDVVHTFYGKELFTEIAGKSEGVPTKPDPAVVNGIVERLGFEKCDCFMIGDTKIDIATGKNAGICTIGCLWGFRTKQELCDAGADHIAERPADIEKIIFDK